MFYFLLALNPMQNLKIVCVGDGAVGKSSLLITYTESRFPQDYVPTVFDNFTTGVEYKEHLLNVCLWDTAGQEEYSRLRALSYIETDVFLVCFSVASESSLDNIQTRWYPELTHHCPEAKFLLVGLKTDLRNQQSNCITTEQGINFANTLRMKYVECSALNSNGLKNVFDTAYAMFIENGAGQSDKKKKKEKDFILPPQLPPAAKAPWINVKSSKYGEERKQMLEGQQDCDVCFLFTCEEEKKEKVKSSSGPVLKKREYDFIEEDIDEDLLCSVCLEPFENGVTHNLEPCRNCFCRDCVSPLKRCPLCREPLRKQDLTLMPRLIHNTINKLKVKCSTCNHQTTRGEFSNHSCAKNSIAEQEYNPQLPQVWAHQIMLASASTFFQRLFHIQNPAKNITPSKFIVQKDIEDCKIPGILGMKVIKEGRNIFYIHLIPEITERVFRCLLEFLYCGEPLSMTESDWEPVKRIGKIFDCKELVTICNNCIEGNKFLNPSIGTWLNDENGVTLLQLFSLKNSNNLADIRWKEFHGHFSLLSARVPAILTRNGRKRVAKLLKSEEGRAVFRVLLDYVYSDHCSIVQNQLQLMSIAYKMKQTRLVSLCELYISKAIQEATSQEVEKAQIDVIDILNQANACNAKQLRKFCLHFLSTNYQAMILRPEWDNLQELDREYVEVNQWPPQSYLKELEEYEKALRVQTKSTECSIM